MNEEEEEKTIKNKFEKAQVSEKKYVNICKTVVCRLLLLALGSYSTYFLGCHINKSFYSLYVFSVIIILDLVYICIFNSGVDFKW